LAAMWIVALLGWLADDSGVTVAAAALPFALPLVIAIHVSVPGAGSGRHDDTGPAAHKPARAHTGYRIRRS